VLKDIANGIINLYAAKCATGENITGCFNDQLIDSCRTGGWLAYLKQVVGGADIKHHLRVTLAERENTGSQAPQSISVKAELVPVGTTSTVRHEP
jgi:hypothetical protein